jgi:hypothetical protein
MNHRHEYKNRVQELERLIDILRRYDIYNVEELTLTLARAIRGYAAQLGIAPLRPRELEYVWQKLITTL